MRRYLFVTFLGVAGCALAACGSNTPADDGSDGAGDDGGDDGPAPPPVTWSIDVDVSGLDRYVPGGTMTWSVAGSAESSDGLAGVDVAGAAATLADGAFSADVAVPGLGLTLVPIVARDVNGHERKAHRHLISAAAFLPEGELARESAGLVLTNAVLTAMADGLAGEAADIDVAGLILERETLSVDDRCTTWPVAAQQKAPEVVLELDQGTLWLNVRIPDLYVYFEGACQGLFSTIPIAGEMAMDVDVWTKLTAKQGEACVEGFNNSVPIVQLPGFYFDVWGTSGPLQGWLVELGSSGKAQEAHDQFVQEFRTQAGGMLGDKLKDLKVFDRMETMEMLGQPVDVHLCLTKLQKEGGQLIARMGSTAVGGGERAAPGAPSLGGPLVMPGASELVLDADLVAQLLFSSWKKGGLAKEDVQQTDLGLITLLAPDLQGVYPEGSVVHVNLDGELPPVVRASAEPGADLRIEIGDLMLDLVVEGDRLFRLGARITLDLDLVPMDGGLVPTVVKSDAEVHLVDEVVDAPDAALEGAVKLKLGDAASALLGGAKLKLPEIPGLGAPVDVTPDAGGRFVRIQLQ